MDNPYRENFKPPVIHSSTAVGGLCGENVGGFTAIVNKVTCDTCKRMIADGRHGINWRGALETLLVSMVERDEDDLAHVIKRTATWLVNNGCADERIRLLAE